jgi:hypothetical protein
MQNANRDAFFARLRMLAEMHNRQLSPALQAIYFEALKDLEFSQVDAALNEEMYRSTFFPKPVEIRERIEGNVEDQAEQAWQWLLREVRRVGYLGTPTWPDAATQHAAEGLFGGWRALCERLPAEGPELLGFRKAFLAGFPYAARAAAAGTLGPSRTEAVGELAEMKRQLQARGLPTGAL